ncbi:ABC-2 transporter permease [Bacillus sp. XF8]|uniref:ABC-2 transporter permease n=1 Tax=Bacillus sp. XF8 TaxID=2819289 RepID=UPI001AA0496A|nr:ABC-2 transporter permease [Bacillus sp. XF8]MBO1579084.1 ABC-2 transporter permease [Bacillus sp. XF8]
MQQLILKDFFLQRKIFLVYLILPVYGMLQRYIEPYQLAVVCFTTCLLMISISLSIEDKNRTEKILVSLPFVRKDIVIAKYLSTVLFVGCGLIITFIFFLLPKFLIDKNINIPWYAIFIAIFVSILYAIMVLPIKYGGNKQTVTIFSLVILFPLVGLLGFMCNVFAEERLMLMFFRSSNVVLIATVLSIGACVAYLISLVFSIAIFKDKEL